MTHIHIKELDTHNKLVSSFRIEVSDLRTFEELLNDEHSFRSALELDNYFTPEVHPFINTLMYEFKSSFADLLNEVDTCVITDSSNHHTFITGMDDNITRKKLFDFCRENV
jgi:hypothetical protein